MEVVFTSTMSQRLGEAVVQLDVAPERSRDREQRADVNGGHEIRLQALCEIALLACRKALVHELTEPA